MPALESKILETTETYATPENVERYLRNMTFTADSEPTESQVQDIIEEQADAVDNYTNRAWRERQVQDYEASYKASYQQKKGRHRAGKYGRTAKTRASRQIRQRVAFNLPHAELREIDSAEGDQLEILRPKDAKDITADEGRDSSYVVDERRGLVRVSISEITSTLSTSRTYLDLDESVKLRITYRYGRDQVPPRVRKATAKLAAAELIETDAYGEILPGGTENAPDQTTAAENLRESAYSTLAELRRKERV